MGRRAGAARRQAGKVGLSTGWSGGANALTSRRCADRADGRDRPEDRKLAQNEERTVNQRESLEKTIAKILHRYCNFGWANYYIPGEKFPSLIEELVEVASPAGEAGHDEIVQFLLRTQRVASAQDRAAKLQDEFAIYRKE
jgi:hypothetical protein